VRRGIRWTLWLLAGALPVIGSSESMDDIAMPAMAMSMPGQFGPYPMARESSGTSWQPDSTPMGGLMQMNQNWMTMWHGFANQIYDHQGGPRGASKSFSNSMLMFMARRSLPHGAFGLRLMISADPLMGKRGDRRWRACADRSTASA
jgi:hypothetical protein